ncbi:MAG TPA: hypothetical protein VF916_03210, partial [Ktedonobacterales bacterium]
MFERSARAGFGVHPLAARLTVADWSQLSDDSTEEPPLTIRAFAERWAQQAAQQRVAPWHTLIESAAALSPAITEIGAGGPVLLRRGGMRRG